MSDIERDPLHDGVVIPAHKYSHALDEIAALRAALAWEADQVIANYDRTALSAKAKRELHAQVDRMRMAARGLWDESHRVSWLEKKESLRRAGVSQAMTCSSWEAERT